MYILYIYICICKPHVYIDWCLHVHCIICQCLLYSIIAGIGNSLGNSIDFSQTLSADSLEPQSLSSMHQILLLRLKVGRGEGRKLIGCASRSQAKRPFFTCFFHTHGCLEIQHGT